ncbi:MAG: prefoldin subunit alpha [Zestosphaera sp.]
MSSDKSVEKKQVVSFEALLAQLTELKKYIDALQNQLNQVQEELNEIKSSINALTEFKGEGVSEFLAPADRRGYVLIRASPHYVDRVITHVGLEYYAELSLDKAFEVLSSREKEYRDIADELQRELVRALNHYEKLENLVNSILIQAQQARAQQARSTSS